MSDRHKKSYRDLSGISAVKQHRLVPRHPETSRARLPSRTSAKWIQSHAKRSTTIMTDSHNRATGIDITPTRYRPIFQRRQSLKSHAFSFLNHHPVHPTRSTERAGPAIMAAEPQIPKTKSHPPSSNTRICACKPSASVSPGPVQARAHSIRRTHTEPIRTIHRAAQWYPGACLGCKPPWPGIGQATALRTYSRVGTYKALLVLLTRRSRCWRPAATARMSMARAGRLVTRSRRRAARLLFVRPEHSVWTHCKTACSFIGACCAAHGLSVHASPLSGPSRRRRRPRDALL